MSPVSGNISWVSPAFIETWLTNEARMNRDDGDDGDDRSRIESTTRGDRGDEISSRLNWGNHNDNHNDHDKNQGEKVVQLESEIEKLKKDVEHILKMNNNSSSNNKSSSQHVSTSVNVHSNQSMLQMQKQVDNKIVLY